MGKSRVMVVKRERADRTPEALRRRDKRIERKLIQLSKDHPQNTYEVKEITVVNKNKTHKLIHIKRTSGRRPHKVKGNKNAAANNQVLAVI